MRAYLNSTLSTVSKRNDVMAGFLFPTRGLILAAEAVFFRKCGGGKQKGAEANESNEEASRHSSLNYITGVFQPAFLAKRRGEVRERSG